MLIGDVSHVMEGNRGSGHRVSVKHPFLRRFAALFTPPPLFLETETMALLVLTPARLPIAAPPASPSPGTARTTVWQFPMPGSL